MFVLLVNGESRLRNEPSEVRQLRGELVVMCDVFAVSGWRAAAEARVK